MDIPSKTRQLYPAEQRVLKTLKTNQEKEKFDKITYYHFLIAGSLAVTFTWLAAIIRVGFLVFLFGTMAVLLYGFIVFTPYEIYKTKKKHKAFLKKLNTFIDGGTVDTHLVNAKRIAVAKEYDDEGDLFIIEYDTDRVLYLWDHDYNLRKKFPCLDFEIYENKFYKMFGRQVYPLSERISPLIISEKAKKGYMRKIRVPEHLQTENIKFEKLIADFNSCA